MGSAEPIRSKENARIKEARALQQRRERQRTRRYLVEGVRLVADAWQAGVRPLTLFVDAEGNARDQGPGRTLIAEMETAGVEVVGCATSVFLSLCETQTPQGIAAVLPLPNLSMPPQPTLVLVLDGVRDPGNAGTLLRSAEAAGVDAVIFGPQTVDPFNGKVVRAGMGAHLRVPLREVASWAEARTALHAALNALLPAEMALYVAEMEAALDYDQVDWARPAALVVGGEAEGASAAARAEATPIRIPMRGRVESLNAAMAGSVILFEAARRRRAGQA